VRRFIPRTSTLLAATALCFARASPTLAYTLEFMDKWGLSFFQTYGPVSSTPGGPSGATIVNSKGMSAQGRTSAVPLALAGKASASRSG
jgi:hypothetical protein